jgi:superfamily II DNA or RNA helicase
MPLRPHQNDALDAMANHTKGQIIVPTGGGKTMCMIEDAKRGGTTVVVAPRILLAEQLSSEFLEVHNDVSVMHVHSGETPHYSSTKANDIAEWTLLNRLFGKDSLIFTTYHSLHRVQESGIPVDTIYFDEAHNSVQRNFFPSVRHFATHRADRCFFFTATPKHSRTVQKAGMNDRGVYGDVLINVPAPKLVDEGYILPPKVEVYKSRLLRKDEIYADVESEHMIGAIDRLEVDKVLICAKSTKQITGLLSQSDFCYELSVRGYSWMTITSKTGAIINGKKVGRDEFFETLNAWGKDDEKKFVVLHHSILAEGINVKGLEAALFMRNMDYITISQTIGRVIRLGNANKTHGKVCVPVYNNVGISTARKVEAVVDTVFNQGQPAISVITR